MYICGMKALFCCIIVFNILQAQPLIMQPTQIIFPPTFEVNTDSQTVKFYNPNPYPVTVYYTDQFTSYDEFPFFVLQPSFTVQPMDSVTVQVYFQPKQNIYFNSEILFHTLPQNDNPYYGTLRLDVQGQGKFINPYYNTTENLIEEDLKTALKNRINLGYVSQGYSQRILMFSTFDNWKVNGRGSANDKVECVYTGRTIENYPMSTSMLVNSPWNFNTEHVFPQSLFSQSEPMRSDFFHLFPTDESINNTRGNLPYNWVTNPVGQNSGCKWDANYFEPRDAFKGTAARALMYFVLKYQDYGNFFAPQENVLRLWHFLFPPDSIEKKRCSDIYTYQQNRNPFIDYPQFLKRITKIIGYSAAPTSYGWFYKDTLIDLGSRPFGNDWYYDFVFVNTGNQSLNLQNIHVNHPDLEIVSGGNDTTLLPFEALTIRLKVNAFQSLTDQLSIYITPLALELKIPIIYTGTTHNVSQTYSNYRIFPNPSEGKFEVHPRVQTVKCWDIYGKTVSLEQVGNQWYCKDCSQGIYFLEFGDEFHKLVIK